MNITFIGFTLDTLGEILLGVTVLKVHFHVIKEHKIDTDVLKEMRLEQVLGILAVILIIVGYLLQLPANI